MATVVVTTMAPTEVIVPVIHLVLLLEEVTPVAAWAVLPVVVSAMVQIIVQAEYLVLPAVTTVVVSATIRRALTSQDASSPLLMVNALLTMVDVAVLQPEPINLLRHNNVPTLLLTPQAGPSVAEVVASVVAAAAVV
jgi:hypothetical protein